MLGSSCRSIADTAPQAVSVAMFQAAVADSRASNAAGPDTATGPAVSSMDRVWTLKELEVLQDMTRPVAVVVNGAYEDPHW